jgi:beta-lactamase regulating signal transducer with metallopeptidase domain
VEERERACDEDVLQVLGEPHVYAEAIVNVCKRFRAAPVVCVSGVSGANLKARLEAIMMNRVGLQLNVIRRFALAAAGAATFAVLPAEATG